MRNFVVLVTACLLFYSCAKNDGCQPTPVDAEKAQLVAYCNTNNITYKLHTSGFLYQVIDTGTGVAPTSNSVITVNYVGKHFNNAIFDSSATPYTSYLSDLIDGWKFGLPLIKKGGRLKLVIPSALAYSCAGSKINGSYVIQPNEPIYFDLTLIDVK